MTNTGNLGTIEAANPVLTVAPLKEDTEMLRATEKITPWRSAGSAALQTLARLRFISHLR